MKVTNITQISATLGELLEFGEKSSSQPLEFREESGSQPPRVLSAYMRTFSGKDTPDPIARIPAADNGVNLFFKNRELLVRWAGMPLPSQKFLLETVRALMRQKQESRVEISEFGWGDKKLVFRAQTDIDQELDIEVTN